MPCFLSLQSDHIAWLSSIGSLLFCCAGLSVGRWNWRRFEGPKQLSLAISAILAHKFQMKGQWTKRWSLDSGAKWHMVQIWGQRYGLGMKLGAYEKCKLSFKPLSKWRLGPLKGRGDFWPACEGKKSTEKENLKSEYRKQQKKKIRQG